MEMYHDKDLITPTIAQGAVIKLYAHNTKISIHFKFPKLDTFMNWSNYGMSIPEEQQWNVEQ